MLYAKAMIDGQAIEAACIVEDVVPGLKASTSMLYAKAMIDGQAVEAACIVEDVVPGLVDWQPAISQFYLILTKSVHFIISANVHDVHGMAHIIHHQQQPTF